MLRTKVFYSLWMATMLGFAGASHDVTTDVPLTGFGSSARPITEVPEDSLLKGAFKRIADKSIASSIYGFFEYMYDSYTGDSISDGGQDMYDEGNRVFFSLDSNPWERVVYDSYYAVPDVYELTSVQSWPFIALMHINNTFSSYFKFSIEVDSNTGADGFGYLVHFNNSAILNGTYVSYTVTQVYGTHGPTICEVYFAFGKNKTMSETFVPIRNSEYGTDYISSGAMVTGYPRDLWLGYMLLSRIYGYPIEPWEVSNAVSELVSAVLDVGDETIQYPFQTLSNVFPTTAVQTRPPFNPDHLPDDSELRMAFERIAEQSIETSISNFYLYEYDSPTGDEILDGGGDMYDGGNMVFWKTNESLVWNRLNYTGYNSSQDAYEVSAMQTWPFAALIRIENTLREHSSFSIRVDSNTGADDAGSLIYFNSRATRNDTNVAYTVTQVYGTADPTICEVFFTIGMNSSVIENFIPSRLPGTGTNIISSGASIIGYPQNAWLGYILLSRPYGQIIEPWEVSTSVTRVVNAVLDTGNNSISLSFENASIIFPTNPPTTTPTTPPSIPNEIPQNSSLRMAFERIANASVTSAIDDFYYYKYDSSTNDRISDGGMDMYDDGNMVSWASNSSFLERLNYSSYYSDEGVLELSVMPSWPFIALMRIDNNLRQSSFFTFKVESNTGADGSGSIIYFNSNATINGTTVVYTVAQVYDADDPTICEVYFAFGNETSLVDNFIPLRSPGTDTDQISSGAMVTGYPHDVWFGYMLLSRPSGLRIDPWEVSNSLMVVVAAVLDVESDSISFPFQTVPIIFPTNPPITTPPPISNQLPEDSELRIAFEKVANKAIASSISDFFFYHYDSSTDDRIEDGGNDMYDGGNLVYWANDSMQRSMLSYDTYDWSPGIYELSIMRSWPFIALMRIENNFQQRSSFSFEVDSNTGADGSGSLIYFNNSATFNGTTVVYTVVQVHGAGDPTICEVFFAFGKNTSLIDNFVPLRVSGFGTNIIFSGARVTGYPRNVWLGYMLLSRERGRRIEPWQVSNSVAEFVSAVLDFGNDSSQFPFQNVSIFFPTTQPVTSPMPTTLPPPPIPDGIPNGSVIHRAFEELAPKLSVIASSIPDFYYYSQLYTGSSSIDDGGNDMYDGGNRVSFGYDGQPKLSVTYGSYYSLQDTYEFASLASWPFVALMRINNTLSSGRSFSIRVNSNAGADGSGVLSHFSSSARLFGIDVAYAVTQVFRTSDPSICEVYIAFSQEADIESNFVFNAMSTNTDDLDTEIILDGYPRNSWIGYMLLSKRNGIEVSAAEVNLAVSQFVSAVLEFSNTIPFSFPYYPTQGPATTATPTTTPYQQHVYVGFRQKVCGSTKFSESNYTTCPSNQTAFITSVTVQLPTDFGFSYPAEGSVFGCMESDRCSQGCEDVGDLIGESATILDCQSRCCYYSYCNYYYDPYYYYYQPSNFTPPNITIPESQLPGVSVEIFPNCFFKPLASRLINCANNVFDAWPFLDSSSCKLTVSSAVRCGIQEISSCTTNELFSNAMLRFPSDINFQQIEASLELSGYLDVICVHPADNIRNATIAIPGPYGDTYHYPLFPEGLIGVGEPICDRFILDSLLEWGIEFLSVLKTSTSRFEMCRSFKTVINRVLHAAENRCDLDALPSLFPCDSLLRNQLRAVIVQAKEFIPQIVPDYCEGIEAHPEPEIPDDIPFLPSCSLRQTVLSMWSCESLFTSKTPYSDEGTCKSNINRLLHCVANRLEECNRGNGYSFFNALTSFLTLEDILTAIRTLTKPSSCSYYGYHSDFRDVICSSSDIHLSQFDNALGNLFGLCRGNSSVVYQQVVQAYYKFAGARNSADVCTAFRSARDSIHEYFKDSCNFGLLQYLLPLDSATRATLSHGMEILINLLPDLEISVCPEPVSTNKTFTPTRWLRSYVRWRSYSLPKWQAAYEEWRSDQPEGTTMAPPACLDLTGITCKNTGTKLCESDYFGCGFCYCSDHEYKCLTETVLEPWIQDYENWETFQASWERNIQEWEENKGEVC